MHEKFSLKITHKLIEVNQSNKLILLKIETDNFLKQMSYSPYPHIHSQNHAYLYNHPPIHIYANTRFILFSFDLLFHNAFDVDNT